MAFHPAFFFQPLPQKKTLAPEGPKIPEQVEDGATEQTEVLPRKLS